MKLLRFYINLFIILAFEVGLVDVVDRIIENMLYKMKEDIFEGNLEKNVKKEILNKILEVIIIKKWRELKIMEAIKYII